jgi:integration host factor subunit beta
VTKKEIVKEIADRANLTQLKTKEIVQWTFDAIVKTLTEDGRIELRNFGVFEVKRRKPRKARNPRTGARVDVEAKNVVTFKPGKKMEEDVGRMTTLPHLDQPVKRSKVDVETDGNGLEDHEDGLETVGGARPRKTV